MKLKEFTRAPTPEPSQALPKDVLEGQMTVDDCIADAEQDCVTEVTPSGLEIFYQWAPKRLYRLRDRLDTTGHPEMDAEIDFWKEVPSVTTVLNVLDKSGALTWWGQKVGVEGVSELLFRGALGVEGHALSVVDSVDGDVCLIPASTQEVVDLLTAHKLTVNHVKDKAADRGVNVHDALEAWCKHGVLPLVEQYPETEQGYIDGLCAFLLAVQHVAEVDGMELMVGSLEHLYAGRLDLILNLSKPVEVVTKTYPKKTDRVEEIPAGRYLLDLKTSKRVYDTHFLQLEAYEQASVECGYQPTDYRGVVHVTEDGRYELALNKDWTIDDFLTVRHCYQVMHERKIVQALRDDFNATDVK